MPSLGCAGGQPRAPATLCSCTPSWAKATCSHQRSCDTLGRAGARTPIPQQVHLRRLQDLLLSPPSLPLASTTLVTLPSPLPCPCPPPHGDSAAVPPESCCSTSCPSPPALHSREGPLPSQLHGGTSAAPPSPPLPTRHGGDSRRGMRGAPVCFVVLPAARCPPAARSLPLSAGPGCLLFSFALQRRGRAVSGDLGSRPPPAVPPVPEDLRVGAVTAPPPSVLCVLSPPPPLRQGLRLPEQPPLPCAPGPPRGHRQREGRGEGLPARGRPGHLR